MKKYFWVIFLGLILTASCTIYIPRDYEGPPPEEYREYEDYYGDMDISFFYDYLSPHGTWVYYSPYGYVWIPYHPGYRWRPYTRGRWIWTDHGWTWFSDLRWGWAAFHYGRWGWDPGLGWFWVPDTVWGPAWVTWRWGNIYTGWAPLPPEVVFVGLRLDSLPFALPNYYWVFVEGRYFFNPYIYRYTLPYERNVTIIKYTVINTNIYVENRNVINRGIDVDHVRRATKRVITKHQLKDANKPGISRVKAREVEIFRPSIRKSKISKPKEFLSKEEAKVRVSRGTIKRPVERKSDVEEESRLKDEHEREIRLLKRTQEREVRELEKKIDEVKKTAEEAPEKEEVVRKRKEELRQLKRSHEKEKSEVTQRHEKEKGKVKKKKNEEEKVKKKKKEIKRD